MHGTPAGPISLSAIVHGHGANPTRHLIHYTTIGAVLCKKAASIDFEIIF